MVSQNAILGYQLYPEAPVDAGVFASNLVAFCENGRPHLGGGSLVCVALPFPLEPERPADRVAIATLPWGSSEARQPRRGRSTRPLVDAGSSDIAGPRLGRHAAAAGSRNRPAGEAGACQQGGV